MRALFGLALAVSVLRAAAEPPKKLVVASASIFADMASNIAGDFLEVRTIVPIGSDPHIYEPTPADSRLVADADLLLVNGLSFEGWLQGLIKGAGAKANVVTITKGIAPIRAVYKNSTDPHAWMSATNGLTYIKNIYEALAALDPGNRQAYEFNYNIYRQQLEDIDSYIRREIDKINPTHRILITSHDAFQYYGREYGLRLESVIGISTEAAAQTADIIRLTNVIRESKVPAVFVESTVNPKLLQQIARDNNVRIGGYLFSDSIGDNDSPAPSYLDMLRYNTATIVAALSGDIPAEESPSHPSRNFPFWLILGAVFTGAFIFVVVRLKP